MVQFKENAEANVLKEAPEHVEINEHKIDRLLYLLHEADPTNPEKDTEEMLKLESEFMKILKNKYLIFVCYRRS